jgi:hypothetical protein
MRWPATSSSGSCSHTLGATLLGCFIHGSMRGYLYASESPWAAKTGSEGIATFEDLPEGAAQVKVWGRPTS